MTVPNPAQERAYPLPAPPEDRRFSLGLVFDVSQVLVEHGFPPIAAGGDLVALQQSLYAFLYAAPQTRVRCITCGEQVDGTRHTSSRDDHPVSPERVVADIEVFACCGKIGAAAPHANFCTEYRGAR